MLVNVEAERVRNQFTKEDLSEKLNVSLRTYYNWINEERDVPSKKLKQMAIIFGTSMDYLQIPVERYAHSEITGIAIPL